MKKLPQQIQTLIGIGLFLIAFQFSATAQKSYGDLYKPTANAEQDIATLLEQAEAEGKHLILQAGGNWCVWCYRFHDFVEQDTVLQKLVDDNFLVYHLNYSRENTNDAILAKYRFPQRFGFPVFVILDAQGQLIHTQDSALLESGDGYDTKKVANFFKAWSPAALDPASYEEKK